MSEEKFADRLKGLAGEPELTAYNVAAVAEAMDSVWSLKGTEAGLKTVQTREGDWKNWDPDVYGVDEATEGGYIRRLRELQRPIVMLSEESDRVEINLNGSQEPLFCVSDPFDGSWLFKRQLPTLLEGNANKKTHGNLPVRPILYHKAQLYSIRAWSKMWQRL